MHVQEWMTACPSGKKVSSNYRQRIKKHGTKLLRKAQQSSLLGYIAGKKGAYPRWIGVGKQIAEEKNQNLDMLLLIMGPLCNISMWEGVGFNFRDLWKTVESVLASDKPGCKLLFKFLWQYCWKLWETFGNCVEMSTPKMNRKCATRPKI